MFNVVNIDYDTLFYVTSSLWRHKDIFLSLYDNEWKRIFGNYLEREIQYWF